MISTLPFLLGIWDVKRTIQDHTLGTRSSFAGTASSCVIPADGRDDPLQASYTELGEMRTGTYRGGARRQLELRQLDESRVMLFFPDGRHFADLDLSSGVWESTHLCRSDCYEITTRVLSRNVVQERWKVRGPSKSYDAETTLARVD